LAHVRQQVLATSTTKRAAWHELSALQEHYKVLDDCLELSTKLRQLFAQLFPANSTEPEPASRLQAMRVVHNLLASLHRPAQTTALTKAWKNYDSYNSSSMFAEFVDANLHVDGASAGLCTHYLDAISRHLDLAHRMYVQTAPASGSHKNTEKKGANDSVAAAAKLLGLKRTNLAAALTKNLKMQAGKKRTGFA
jgi:hypothetical protein